MRSWVLMVAAAVLLVAPAVMAQLRVPSVRMRATGSSGGEPLAFERIEQTYFVDVAADATNSADGFRNQLNIRFGNNLGNTDIFRWDFEFAMPEGVPFTVNDYPNPSRSVGGRGTSGYMKISASGTNSFSCSGSDPRTGRSFSLIEITHDAEENIVHSASFSFVEVCTGKNLTGTLEFQRDGDFGDDGDDGGGQEPTEPPPPFQIQVPLELEIEPFVVGANGSQKVELSTAITSGFNSDLHLAVETDALEHEDFHATITPNVIPAPGAGKAELSITTGPLTFPRVYGVKLIASANDQVFERQFLVHVLCDPPFILGTNQPENISAANGSQVTLEVTPSGTGPFFYQWYKGIPGMTRNPVLAANESKLIFTTRETATYWVRVSNACGTVNSTAATVTTTGTLSGPPRRRGGRS